MSAAADKLMLHGCGDLDNRPDAHARVYASRTGDRAQTICINPWCAERLFASLRARSSCARGLCAARIASAYLNCEPLSAWQFANYLDWTLRGWNLNCARCEADFHFDQSHKRSELWRASNGDFSLRGVEYESRKIKFNRSPIMQNWSLLPKL